MLKEKFPEACEKIATGLAGPGSECFGFDDELSRDHDWGPSFCLWLADTDAETIGPRLATEYARLPSAFMGFGPRTASPGEEHRVGPCRTWDFYQTYLGARDLPKNFVAMAAHFGGVAGRLHQRDGFYRSRWESSPRSGKPSSRTIPRMCA